MKLSHKDKIRLARSMMSNEEIQNNVKPFNSKKWRERTEARRLKELSKMEHGTN
jgi:hypothetical protein